METKGKRTDGRLSEDRERFSEDEEKEIGRGREEITFFWEGFFKKDEEGERWRREGRKKAQERGKTSEGRKSEEMKAWEYFFKKEGNKKG